MVPMERKGNGREIFLEKMTEKVLNTATKTRSENRIKKKVIAKTITVIDHLAGMGIVFENARAVETGIPNTLIREDRGAEGETDIEDLRIKVQGIREMHTEDLQPISSTKNQKKFLNN
jgi:hypothetical protein